jgi:hypothetical protein
MPVGAPAPSSALCKLRLARLIESMRQAIDFATARTFPAALRGASCRLIWFCSSLFLPSFAKVAHDQPKSLFWASVCHCQESVALCALEAIANDADMAGFEQGHGAQIFSCRPGGANCLKSPRLKV